ncbi:MAG: hypothetical protein M3N13_07000 [Candidatus Eremiobacteraeota bacterium]|nr:hypothetical protein [Candidatus Eremiobacteraeota bacterium]
MDSSRRKGSRTLSDPRIAAIPDVHGHAKGEHRPFSEERPIAYSSRMLFLWFYHACRRNSPRFLMVSDHINYLTFEDPGAVNTVRRALKLAHAGDLYGAAETAGVDVAHAAIVSEGLRRGMRYSIGAEVDNDPRARPDAQNIVDAMRPDGIIRSVHFLTIDHPEKGGEYSWPYDNPEFSHFYDAVGVERVWELYTTRLFDDIEKLPGHIVGHFYKPGIFGHWPDDAKLERYEDALLEAALARGMAVEINTRPLYRDIPEEQRRKYIDVNKRLMRKAKAKNVPITIGSDAHSPKDQGGAFETVLKMLDDCDINEIVFPVGGRLARVALRATKEHMEAHKTQEPAQPGSSISGLSRAELGLPAEADRTPEEIAAAKSGRDAGPKKRASSPARTTKKPAATDDGVGKTSSRRTAESAASSAKAKANASKTELETPKERKPSKAAKPLKETKPPKAVKPDASSKPVAAKTPVVTSPTAKAPVLKVPAAKAPAAKAPAAKVPAAKLPATKKTAGKPMPDKKMSGAKTASKPVKAGAKSPAKATTKKLPAKTAAKPPAKTAVKKKSAAKKAVTPLKKTTAKKSPAKAAAMIKKPAGKPAKKTTTKKPAAAARPAKKAASKPAAKSTTGKKKSTTKRR